MIELLQTVATVAGGLTAGELFAVADTTTSEIGYVVGDYPYKSDNEGFPPLGVVLLRTFSPGPGQKKATVDLAFTLYSETREAAMVDITRLASLLEPLTGRSARYAPWKLLNATGFAGDREHGAHPDPQYYLTYQLDFSGA